MGNVYEDRPEIGQASAAFRLEQLEAFLRLEPRICGIEVLPFTPRMAMELELSGNVFVAGGTITAEDCIQFIHRIYKDFHPDSQAQIDNLTVQLLRRHPIDEIQQYLERTHAAAECFANTNTLGTDGPPLPKKHPSDSSWLSILVDVLCKRYGWSIERVLDTPYRITWQLMNRILEEKDPDYIQRSPNVMRMRQEYLEQQQRDLELLNKAKGRRVTHGS